MRDNPLIINKIVTDFSNIEYAGSAAKQQQQKFVYNKIHHN